MSAVPDPHRGPVPATAWAADAAARARGRVLMLNAGRPGGVDGGWTMDAAQYEAVRAHLLEVLDADADADGAVPLSHLVRTAQERFGADALFPGGRLRNCVTFTKVDLEARCEIERVPGAGAQRLRRWVGPPPPPLAG
ncbi:hypothetical protein GTR02_14425 [Kineococcus sp. R8]|uniref:DUF6958 family protein n=1 Tax=Kineococcus siccus TaxID=2696567 RepID=UPI00141364CE|nr:hypothetical protein [Kineococcus siccus]NAZ83012.1 hypothetical protein [Kineococcus siccus]